MLKVYVKDPSKFANYNQVKTKEKDGGNHKLYQAENNLEVATNFRNKQVRQLPNVDH